MAIRRKSTPSRGVVCAGGKSAGRIGGGETAPRQGTFVQQFCGSGSGTKFGGGVPEPRGGHHQAQQSLRDGGAGDAARRVFESVGVRSGFGLWRSAGVQSRGG